MAKSKSKTSVGILDALLDAEISKAGASKSKIIPNYPMGIKMIDYRNAREEDGIIKEGFNGGKIITFIGKSGSGKTSAALKLAFNTIAPYEEGQLIHMDYENATTPARAYSLARTCGLNKSDLEGRYKYLNENIYTETLYKLVKATAKLKLEHFDELKIEYGEDEEGNKIYILPPTVFLVDSWASVIPEDISGEEELSGQMSATSIARQNNAVIKRITQHLVKANIMLIVINHITTKVEINPYQRSAKDLNYLGIDESCPGGSSVIFLADSLIKLQAGSKLEEDKDYGIKGFMVNGLFLKTRSNEAGRPFELVFNQKIGFDDFYTNFNYLKKEKYLKGNGRAYYFDFDPDTKFTQKNVKELYDTNEEWAKLFDEFVEETYINFITTKDIDDEYEEDYDGSDYDEDDSDEDVELVKCINKKKDIWKGSDGNKYYGDGTPYDEE